LYVYTFDEETGLYKYEGLQKDFLQDYSFSTNYPIGYYVLSRTILPDNLVSGENATEENDENQEQNWCVETEVESLIWTEEDINKVLADIEETKNNTTGKQLFVNVPSGSTVPAKIFEASKGINIAIVSECGIWANFSGGNYKAIDYVAGGTISSKVIDGMVNVGEENIVYISLKHEGELPSTCIVEYINGYIGGGQGFRYCRRAY